MKGLALAGVSAFAGILAAATPVVAQVTYQPYRPPAPAPYSGPGPYGYPVPFGFLQPDEVLGTSPSFDVDTGVYGRAPVTRVVRRCQYPDSWNVTDFSRDVNGIPNGLDHTCPVGGPGSRRIAY